MEINFFFLLKVLHLKGQLSMECITGYVQSIDDGMKSYTSARKISMAKPLKQLMTACWMSNPRLSKALIVESKRPGLRPQNMWMFMALPSRSLTSTFTFQN